MNSVRTLRPIWVLVIAWMMPIGKVKKNEIPRARKKPHQVRFVGKARMVTRLRPIMRTNRLRYHHIGASLYFAIN